MKHLILLFFIVAAFASCVSKKKLQQSAIAQYPVRDSMVIHHNTLFDTMDIPPLEVTIRDTVDCPPDTVKRRVPVENKVTIPARRVPIQIPTVDTTNWLRYTAIEEILKDELKKCNQTSAEWKGKAEVYKAQAKSAGKWFWWFLVMALTLIGTTVFRFLGYLKF